VLILWPETMERGFASSIWMTFRQASELDAHVRMGESGAMVVYASRFTKTEVDAHGGEIEQDIPFVKADTVFNCDQIDGLPDHHHRRPELVIDPVERIAEEESFFANTCAVIRHEGVLLAFRDAASYSTTLGHECIHWTGASHRLNRDISRCHNDLTERARERLVADMGASFFCADLGIVPELEPPPDRTSCAEDRRNVSTSCRSGLSGGSCADLLDPLEYGIRVFFIQILERH
jgi:antirestriction protein ArdC